MSSGQIALRSGDGELELREVHMEAVIVAAAVEATITMVFYNPLAKRLEGELDLPLPEGAVVAGYSYEHNGRMLPATIVKKEDAIKTFEKERALGRAVGLVEQVKGNSFKVKVFPLLPNAEKRVSVSFLSDLAFAGEGGAARFGIPITVTKPLAAISMTVRAVGTNQPRVVSALPGFKFEREWAGAFKGFASAQNTPLPTALSIEIPSRDPAPIVTVATNKRQESFFYINEVPPKAVAPSSDSSSGSLHIFWDASMSLAKADRARSYAALSVLARAASKIILTVYRNVPEAPVTFSGAQVDALVKHVREAPCDGGTDVGLLNFPKKGEVDKVLWFTDGFATLSRDLPNARNVAPVYIFTDAALSNAVLLTPFAGRTGGQLFNLRERTNDKDVAATVFGGSSFGLLGVSVLAGGDEGAIDDVYPFDKQILGPGEAVTVVGRLKADCQVQLTYGFGWESITHTSVHTLRLADARAGLEKLVPRQWAQRAVAELTGLEGDAAKQMMLDLGRAYGIVTPGASLLVLTEVQQYLDNKIEPDEEALPDIHAEYMRRKASYYYENAPNKIHQVKNDWAERKQWYNATYPDGNEELSRREKARKEAEAAAAGAAEMAKSGLLRKNSVEGGAVPQIDSIGGDGGDGGYSGGSASSDDEAKASPKLSKPMAAMDDMDALDEGMPSTGAAMAPEPTILSKAAYHEDKASISPPLMKMSAPAPAPLIQASMAPVAMLSPAMDLAAPMSLSDAAPSSPAAIAPPPPPAASGPPPPAPSASGPPPQLSGVPMSAPPPPPPVNATAAPPPPPPASAPMGGPGGPPPPPPAVSAAPPPPAVSAPPPAVSAAPPKPVAAKSAPSSSSVEKKMKQSSLESMSMKKEIEAPPPAPMLEQEEEAMGEADMAPSMDEVQDDYGGNLAPSRHSNMIKWEPDHDYILAMGRASSEAAGQYAEYLRQREAHYSQPSFYLDCGFVLLDRFPTEPYGLRVITAILELGLEEPRLMRIVGNKLLAEHVDAQALFLFQQVVRVRGFDPWPHRELGLAYIALGRYQEGIDTLYKVVTGEWDIRFQKMECEALLEINRAIWLAGKKDIKLDTSAIDPEFIYLMPMAVRATITWDIDELCVDLHTYEPLGDVNMWSHTRTPYGGWGTPDYGGCPAHSTSMHREYMTKNGTHGKYEMIVDYFGNYRFDLTGEPIVWLTVYSDFCTDKETQSFAITRLSIGRSGQQNTSTNRRSLCGVVSY